MRQKRNHKICWKAILLVAGMAIAPGAQAVFAQSAASPPAVPAGAVPGKDAVSAGASLPSAPALPAKKPAADDKGLPVVSIGKEAAQNNGVDKGRDAAAVKHVNSLFFSQEEMAHIRDAVAAYQKLRNANLNAPGNTGKNAVNPPQDQEKSEQITRSTVYAQFFLASLAYHSPHDWAIQINNQRITSSKQQESLRLRVLAIDNDKVTLEWQPYDMVSINDVWNRMPHTQEQKNTGQQNAAKTEEVKVDESTVTFTLRPNQTFSSYAMRALEGKVKPVPFENAIINSKDMTPEIPAADVPEFVRSPGGGPGFLKPPAVPDNAAEDNAPADKNSDNQGLRGLINSYKRLGAVPQ